MTIEIVDLPIKDGDFPYFLYVYQRVTAAVHKERSSDDTVRTVLAPGWILYGLKLRSGRPARRNVFF